MFVPHIIFVCSIAGGYWHASGISPAPVQALCDLIVSVIKRPFKFVVCCFSSDGEYSDLSFKKKCDVLYNIRDSNKG